MVTLHSFSFLSYRATLGVPPAEADPHGVRGGREGDEDGHDGEGQSRVAVGVNVHFEGGRRSMALTFKIWNR